MRPSMSSPSTERAEPEHAEPEHADPEAVARAIVLRRLESAPRTRGELEVLLRRRNVPVEVSARVLDRFTEVGLIDDRAFAQAWVSTRHAGRGLGRRSLAAELRRRSVAPDLIEEALGLIDAEGERARALDLARRRAARLTGQPVAVAQRRLLGALVRRGYAPGLAAAVVREVLAEESDSDAMAGAIASAELD